MTVEEVQALATAIRQEVGKAVVGQEATVDLMLVALFAGGHILLEGPPGTAKTLLAHSFARAIGLEFGRIQFTPDLMPGDIIGANLFNFQTSSVHADARADLHRPAAGRRDQPHPAQDAGRAAGGDAGAHRDDRRREPVARRPLHGGGDAEPDRAAGRLSAARGAARPLPVQADGRLSVAPRRSGRIIATHGARATAMEPDGLGRRAAMPTPRRSARRSTRSPSVQLVDEVIDYIAALIRAHARTSPTWRAARRPRAGAMLAGAARARAALDGRDFVIPDDVKALAPALLRHRLILSPAAEIDGRVVEDVVARHHRGDRGAAVSGRASRRRWSR